MNDLVYAHMIKQAIKQEEQESDDFGFTRIRDIRYALGGVHDWAEWKFENDIWIVCNKETQNVIFAIQYQMQNGIRMVCSEHAEITQEESAAFQEWVLLISSY